MLDGNRHQRRANARAPVRLIDGDGVDLAEPSVHRVAAGADADKADDRSTTLGDPPSVRERPAEVAPPAFSDLVRHRPVRPRHELAVAGVPRVDVDAYDDFGVGLRGLADCRRFVHSA